MNKYIKNLKRSLGLFPSMAFILSIGLLLLSPSESQAQFNSFGAGYYQNQYLFNPAKAGLNRGLTANLSYLQQWGAISNAPVTQSITGQYGLANNMGIGLNFYEDKAGVLKSSKVVGTYAYHLPLNADDRKLSFGVSAGFMKESIDVEDSEDLADESVMKFNNRGMHFDGDLGLAYTSNGLNIQVAVPNVMTLRDKENLNSFANSSVMFSSISYKTKIDLKGDANPMGIEPMLAYRMLEGAANILDLGARVTMMQEHLNLTTIFHTTNSFTFGVGINYKSLGVVGIYSTKPEELGKYAANNFEVGLQFSLWNDKN